MNNDEAKMRLNHYRRTIFNSNPKFEILDEKSLLELAERALHLKGDWSVQFERLLMEAKIDFVKE